MKFKSKLAEVGGGLSSLPSVPAYSVKGQSCSDCGDEFKTNGANAGDSAYWHDKELVCRACAEKRLKTDGWLSFGGFKK